jgi:hypothetical protein
MLLVSPVAWTLNFSHALVKVRRRRAPLVIPAHQG